MLELKKKTVTDPVFGDVELSEPANLIYKPEDCIRVLGKNFEGSWYDWYKAIEKNIPAIMPYRAFVAEKTLIELRDNGAVYFDDDALTWKFKAKTQAVD